MRPTTSNGNFHIGCYSKVATVINDHSGAVGGVALAILIIMVRVAKFATLIQSSKFLIFSDS